MTLEQPDGCNAKVERCGQTTTITLEPTGLIRGYTLPRIVTGVILCGFLIWMTRGALVSHHSPPVLEVIFLLALWAVALSLVLVPIQLALRKAVFVVTPDTLAVTIAGPLHRRRYRWARGELAAVDVERFGPYLRTFTWKFSLFQDPRHGYCAAQLCLYSTSRFRWTGGIKQMLTGRDSSELKWLASVIRQTLEVPQEPPWLAKNQTNTSPRLQ